MRKLIFNLALLQSIFFISIGAALGQKPDSTLVAIPSDTTAIQEDSTQEICYQTDEELVQDIIVYAKKFLGTPYVYGGTTPKGFDCSGYVRYVMHHFGVELTRTSASMSELGEEIPLSEVQPGDLMFFKGRNISSTKVGHVSMVISVENDVIQFIHAAGNRVKIDTFNDSRYYVPRFIKATRLPLNKTNTE